MKLREELSGHHTVHLEKGFPFVSVVEEFAFTFKKISLIDWFILRQREERVRERNIDLLLHFIGCFLYLPPLGTEPTTLAYQDNALTNWVPSQGKELAFF